MSEIRSTTGDAAIALVPRQVTERGQPTWLRVLVRVDGPTQSWQELVSFTLGDIDELADRLTSASSRREEFEFTGQDETLRIRVTSVDAQEQLAVAVWVGEPYVAMRGHRIIVERNAVSRWASDLREESDDL